MDSPGSQQFPQLAKDDEGLKKEIEELLTASVSGNPYDSDGAFAASIANLPPGLRAMAATHWLDISLTLDSITWHFANFGEPGLVAATEVGLHELGLHELAQCFADARDLMVPLLANPTDEEVDAYQIIERAGLSARAEDIDRRASVLGNPGGSRSAIYESWTRYARQFPERVFPEPILRA